MNVIDVSNHAASQLLPLVYDDLRRLAAQKLAQETPGQTLQPTALVHEAYLRLTEADAGRQYQSREHFFFTAAEAMRRVLLDRARRKKRLRHGGGRQRVAWTPDSLTTPPLADDLLAVDEALSLLAQEDPEAAEVVKLRLYVGLSVEEAADALGISRASAYRHWAYARAWLQCALEGNTSPPP